MSQPSRARRLPSEEVDALYREHAAKLERFLRAMLRDGDLAAEALQRTFLLALERGGEATESRRRAWLFKVAFHEATDLRRRGRRNAAALEREADALHSRRDVFDPPLLELLRREDEERARLAIDALPPEQKRVFELRFQDGRTFQEIADELGIPLGTALTRSRLALQKLKGRLES